ncbi:uncharacterized protein LOC113911348 isoform X2 [Zalophus californianus]|uniref:Uncharacterized protein LOC113911348 isoform X2 n=1 Tax=Zalophus californianus TaxID=9704 RepID=A0A6P9FEY2_ZALCA|nr:uncharacterized protein LOC113911348 isoform X2 [Zalophus californianus]
MSCVECLQSTVPGALAERPWDTLRLFMALLECPHNMAAGFPQNERSKRQRQKQECLSSWTSHLVTSMVLSWSQKPALSQRGRRVHTSMNTRRDKVCLKWPLRAGLIHRIKVTAVEHRGKQQKAEVFQENCTPGQRGGSSQSGRSEDWCGYRSVLRACWRSGQSVVGVWQILAERKNGQKTKEKNLMYESENCSL